MQNYKFISMVKFSKLLKKKYGDTLVSKKKKKQVLKELFLKKNNSLFVNCAPR